MSDIIICETENYIFSLPKNMWEEEKIALPGDLTGYFLAPHDLEAKSKKERKTVDTFELKDELLYADTHLFRPNGWTIIENWEKIIESCCGWLAGELETPKDSCRKELLNVILNYKLNLTCDHYSGAIHYWSKTIKSDKKADSLYFDDNTINYHLEEHRFFKLRVRCISQDKPRLKAIRTGA